MKVDIKVIIIVVMSIVLMGNQGIFDDEEVGRYEPIIYSDYLCLVDTKKGEMIRVSIGNDYWTHIDYINHKITDWDGGKSK